MLKGKQSQAVELLMSYPDYTVAEKLGVRLRTLTRWAAMPEVSDAIRDREREQKRAVARLATQAVLRAAAALCEKAKGSESADPKLMLEVLKAASAFEAEQEDPGEALAQVLQRISEAD